MDPQSVFKAYDVRGRADTGELDADLYRLTGAALVGVIGADTIAVGRDCRSTSWEFADALAAGVTAAGGDVIDVGEVPTDAIYYFSGARQVHGAIVTASHNPAEYNGLKLCGPGAAPIGMDSGLSEIRDSVIAGRAFDVDVPGLRTEESIVSDYVAHLMGIVEPASIAPLRVAVDGGNGMAGVAIHQVFDMIASTMEGLYLEPDGTFPNHPADPLVAANLRDLVALMASGDFDIGVAFDGDADRAFFLDGSGEALSGSTVTSLVGRRILADNPGASVVHNLITSKAVPEIISEAGGVPVRTRVGHSFIKQVMADTDAVFGGEHSGHYYFKDNFRADSGMLAMLYLLRVMSEDGRPLAEIRRDVERYTASGEINFEVSDPVGAMELVAEEFSAAEVDHLDGLTVDLGDRWFNLRASNTEPLLRLNAEADSAEDVRRLVDHVRETLEGEK